MQVSDLHFFMASMSTFNPKVDGYINRAAPYAKPILEWFRKAVHKASAEITESIKWGVPSFDYNGKIMCSIAAFKQHCAIAFWLGRNIKALQPYLKESDTGDSNFGRIKDIKTVKDLPKDLDLIAAVKEAIALMDEGVAMKRTSAKKAAPLAVPKALAQALAKDKAAKSNFEKFAPSHRKEYIQWINEAKTEVTKDKRIATTVEWVSEGKGKNWMYERKG